MILAIPVDNNSLDASVCVSFGRAPYFLFYDTADASARFVENTAQNATGGAGIKAAQIIVDAEAKALLTPRCGTKAADVLWGEGITMYKTQSRSIQENIDAFKAETLDELTETHAGHHGRH